MLDEETAAFDEHPSPANRDRAAGNKFVFLKALGLTDATSDTIRTDTVEAAMLINLLPTGLRPPDLTLHRGSKPIAYYRESTPNPGARNATGRAGKGELRYGSLVVDNRFGESHHWFHWRCVPKKVLQRLKSLNMTGVQGWHSLSAADQQHARDNVARGQASYSVAPAPAAAAAPGPPTPGPSTQKRKRESEIPVIEIPDDDEEEEPIPVEDEVVEELSSAELMRGMTYTLPADIKIYGRSDQRAMLEGALKWATPGQRGFDDTMRTAEFTGNPARRSALPPPVLPSAPSYATQASSSQAASSSAAAKAVADAQRRYAEAQKVIELRPMLDSLSKVDVDDEARRTGLLDALCGVDGEDGIDVLKLPELESKELPLGLHADVELMKHQKQALKWCLAKEYPKLPASESDRLVQFCAYKKQSGKPYYYNKLTHMPSRIENPPVLGCGGLIADAMGLGKTLTVLALVLLTKSEPKTAGFSGATLIVCPLSVLSWEKQIAETCAALRIFDVHILANRLLSPEAGVLSVGRCEMRFSLL
ncbi:hypothetical protein AURDEDRAFT_167788 [Auricularia subglabra TFB-10046 SS5]|nr:hypothetical protein AURDEDRAFT_167788 [Auricularia subglabra TFB-10046 SS5]